MGSLACGTESIGLLATRTRRSRGVIWAEITNIRCQISVQVPFWETWSEAEEEGKDGIHQPLSPKSTSVGYLIVTNLKPAPQTEHVGQTSRPLLQKDSGYVSVCCVHSAVGVVASQELPLFAIVLWNPGKQALLATRPRQSRAIPRQQPQNLGH